jgi:heme/copper-type cytochrome/quinol oxidase subunit 3
VVIPENELAKKQRSFTKRERAWATAGFGLCFILLSWMEYLKPSVPPFTGTWGWLEGWMYTQLGPHGISVGYFIIGAACLLWGGYDLLVSQPNVTKNQSTPLDR